jgi:integral membrane sensor domain MASE1
VPKEDREFGFDLRYAWALVLALQFLILAEVLMLWSLTRFGKRSTYLVFTPTLLLATILVLDQITRLLPNLL